ncbi:serine/threonine protein kinase [Nocardiopsis sp. CNR-923]|uniref:serine/threonine-protein kinase n=1 Tax=Nocardiopsis sp. CNR-923 TaxID=1904965 RepID=UPI000969611D|nr:serine/threonine-protein kinase [Nocardiopsis sp. CNR-923]OLT29338.1 serine/threonine protein kinase [Nocardiopsis sp. CNR-923]
MNSSAAEPSRALANRYRLDEIIGEGGMGRVWRGTDTLLDRPVAVKELTTPPGLPAQEVEVLRTRMLREARSAAQLSHPSIITVFDVAEEDGRPWIVMELVHGPSLGDLVRSEGTLSVLRVADIGEQMCAGLSEAHGRGIVHRDIKPGNVLIAGDDRAVLTDFGIAHLDGSTHLTSTGLLIGSPSYLAPEVAQGFQASPASDAWALGVTLFQAVEGSLPFDRPTPMATLTAICTQDLPEPVEAGPLRPVLEGLCAKEPEDRLSIAQARALLREVRDAEEAASFGGAVTLGTTRTTEAPGAAPATDPADAVTGGAADVAWATDPSAHSLDAPAPGPRPAGAARAAGAGWGSRMLMIVAVLVVLLGVAVTSVLVSMNRPQDPAGLAGSTVDDAGVGADGEPREPDAAPSDEAAADDEDGEGEGEDEADAGEDDEWDFLTRHEDSTGFAVDVPEDWTIERRDSSVFFHNPDGGYLQVDQTDAPNPDAGDDWRAFEPVGSQNFRGYTRTGIEDVEADWADAYVSAADWEFTYDGGDGRMHAINRGFHTENMGYALFLVASNDDPDANRALLDRMAESFEPAA